MYNIVFFYFLFDVSVGWFLGVREKGFGFKISGGIFGLFWLLVSKLLFDV